MKTYNIYFATENKKQLNKILSLCVDVFGGYTHIKTFGGWKDKDNIKYIEEANKVTIITNKTKELNPLCKWINYVANQQSTLLETTNNKSNFIN